MNDQPAPAVPSRVAGFSIFIGLVIAGVGLWIIVYKDWVAIYGALAMCVGFGILLAAVGSTATWKYRGLTATGAGALAIILFLILMRYVPSNEFQISGHIAGPINKIADLRIIDDHPLYTFRNRNTRTIEFVILKRHFANPQLRLQVDTNEEGEGKEFFELYGNGDEISARYFGKARFEIIKWTLDYDRRIVTDGAQTIFKVPDRFEERLITDSSKRRSSLNWRDFFIRSANAQSKRPEVNGLITDLGSTNVIVRRNARDDLINSGPTAVRPLLDAFQKAPDHYRTKLGVVYSLNGMLRDHPEQSATISTMLSASDLELLASTIADSDKTVRLQATEFMFQLKDERIVEPLLQTIRYGKSGDGTYNSVLVLKSIFPTLDASKKLQIQAELADTIPMTNERTRALVDHLGDAK